MIGLAFFEAAGIASVIPFLGVLGDPEIIQKNSRLKVFYEYSQMYGISSTANFLILLGVLSFTFIVISALYRSLTQYFLARFVETFRHNLSVRLVKKFLGQPYEVILTAIGDNSKNSIPERINSPL